MPLGLMPRSTADTYVIGRIIEAITGGLGFDSLAGPLEGRDAAVRVGYQWRSGTQTVWLVDGPEPRATERNEAPKPKG